MKIKKIEFINHKILGNLVLDFNDDNGVPCNTIVFAGENGTGKSTILNAIYQILNYNVDFEFNITIESESICIKYEIRKEKNQNYYTYNIANSPLQKFGFIHGSNSVNKDFNFVAIYSDVEINYDYSRIESVKSSNVDTNENSSKSNKETAKSINQMLVDIIALDDSSLASVVRVGLKKGLIDFKEAKKADSESKIKRFADSFKLMFDGLKLEKIDNVSNNKVIYFIYEGEHFPIDNLSSGEKQIVYRGCFLLKDINSLAKKHLFGIVDEPEISMHPKWQKKILNYYQNIFKNSRGEQFAQLFVATHSEKVIANTLEDKNAKIILLEKEKNRINVAGNNAFVISTKSASEINYVIFKDASIDYHNLLFSLIQSKIESQLSSISSVRVNTYTTDRYIKEYLNKNKHLNISSKNYKSDSGNYEYYTLPMCIRNAIDHPADFVGQPTIMKRIDESIELMREIINSGIDSTIIPLII